MLAREGWQVGMREDWRFQDMRKRCGGNWWWQSLPLVYLSQQLMLVGLPLPLYALSIATRPGKIWVDALAIFVCISGPPFLTH